GRWLPWGVAVAGCRGAAGRRELHHERRGRKRKPGGANALLQAEQFLTARGLRRSSIGREIPSARARFSAANQRFGVASADALRHTWSTRADWHAMGGESLLLPGFDSSTGLFMVPWWAAAALAAF